MHRMGIALLCIAAVLASARIVEAAGDHEVTIVPLGHIGVAQGSQEISIRLPQGPRGPLPQPVVLVASQPWVRGPAQPPLVAPPAAQEGEEEEVAQQIPGTVRFTLGGTKLPDWSLEPHATAYVLNMEQLRKSSTYELGFVDLTVELDSQAEGVNVQTFGMPDPLLASDSKCGLLSEFTDAASDPHAKAYLAAFNLEIAGKKDAARVAYQELQASGNERVARLVRRGLRLSTYETRKYKLSGNHNEHYRWGLYLQECGLYAPAFAEFEECRIILPRHADSQFRAGEMNDHRGAGVSTVLHYMDRTLEATSEVIPVDWYVLVTILRSRSGKTLKGADIALVKDTWFVAEKMIWAATSGRVRTITSFHVVPDEQQHSYVSYPGGLTGPAANIVEQRGWFDSVVSVRPRLDDEPTAPAATLGGDQGPNGAALSTLFHDAQWPDYLEAWVQQAAWAMQMAELEPLPPITDQAIGCGHRPVPGKGYGIRAALRYYISPEMHRLPKISESVPASAYLTLWKIDGPYPVQDQPPTSGQPGRHAAEPLPAAAASNTVNLVSDEPFINLAKLFPDAGWSRAQATCWVFSPADEDVRMWLGQNDGLALWLNGRCIHEGRYYSSNNYADKNLPNTVAAGAELRRGWNEFRVVVESWPAPFDKGWGFSVALCDWKNRPLSGLACVHELPAGDLAAAAPAPKPGGHYAWADVRDDFYRRLPRLSNADLQAVTGVNGLTLNGEIQHGQGCVTLAGPALMVSPACRVLERPWAIGQDRDVALNNVLDWERESCLALRYTQDGKPRDLLLVKLESVESYLRLLDEPSSAAEVFGNKPPAERLLGYVLIPAGSSQVALLVADTMLGKEGTWPLEEEDLLQPISPVYVRNPPKPVLQGPPKPEQPQQSQ